MIKFSKLALALVLLSGLSFQSKAQSLNIKGFLNPFAVKVKERIPLSFGGMVEYGFSPKMAIQTEYALRLYPETEGQKSDFGGRVQANFKYFTGKSSKMNNSGFYWSGLLSYSRIQNGALKDENLSRVQDLSQDYGFSGLIGFQTRGLLVVDVFLGPELVYETQNANYLNKTTSTNDITSDSNLTYDFRWGLRVGYRLWGTAREGRKTNKAK
ncbi:MAG: hypothetical protein EAZ57_10685 [Cytophagales bacterium]|nr:MAG: hypothetical protein EAZ67_11290 [Cytophagales bacterium]TAF59541.1 MAG: hypothetical protein EAZ57_10685 [Cytophagales bacterium]